MTERNWTVLFILGASGSGKSSVAYQLGQRLGVNIMEADDVHQAVKAVTNRESHPAMHGGENWMEVSVDGNVRWLIDVSRELEPALRAIVENHLDADVPVIIEGDFIQPDFAASYDGSKVKAVLIYEPDKEQYVQNFMSREGGSPQDFRADICVTYNSKLMEGCEENDIPRIHARPWDTVIERIVERLT